MSEFGWAYVVGTMVQGVSGSVQTAEAGRLSGSNVLVWDESDGSGSLRLTGSLNVSGAINANELNINVVNRNVINLDATGSTKFGDSSDDTHVFTGSILLSGATNPLKIQGIQDGTGGSSGHYLALDANNQVVLTSSVPDGGTGLIDQYTNPGATRIITSIDSTGINAEDKLLFDGSRLTLTGHMTASVGISSSVGQFTQLSGASVTDGIALLTAGSLTNAVNVNANNLGGELTTVAQPQVTSLGTLTALDVSGDVSASALFVSSSTERVGIGTNSPEKKLEIYDKSDQLRLTYSKFIPFLESNVHTDFETNSDGYLILDPTGQRVGIGTASPQHMLDVDGNMRVGGNLEVTGTLSARVTDFVVSANNITFGDSATDQLTFNAATASVPNSLNIHSNLLSLDTSFSESKVGIGVQYPDSKLEVLSDSEEQLKVSYDQNKFAKFGVSSTGVLSITSSLGQITASSDLYVSGNVTLGRTCNDIITSVGQFSASCGISASVYYGTAFSASDGFFENSIQIGNNTVIISPTTISGATTITGDNLAGVLTKPAQPNITSLGNLTNLTVDTTTLVVDTTTDRVGIGIADPRNPLEILHSSAKQLRLSQQQTNGLNSNIYTDFQTNDAGYLLIDPSGQRIGIGTSSPKAMLDVDGNMRIGGNLEVTGALRAKVTEFIVDANNITFGDSATDTLIFNAASGTVMNGLNWDNDTFVMDSDSNRIGIGVSHPDTKLHVLTTNDQLKLSYNSTHNSTFGVASSGDLTIKPTGTYITASSGLKVSGSTSLGSLASHHTIVSGELSASVALSSSVGAFTFLTGSAITDGTTTITGGDISGVGTLTAVSVDASITKAAQPNVTSLGTLTSLAVTGDLTVDTATFKVNSSTNRIGIGVTDPTKPLEISSSAGGIRLTYSRAIFGGPSLVYSDLSTDSDGRLVLASSGNKTKITGELEITGLSSGAGVTTKYLALDSGNNIVLTSSTAAGIETRNRRVITGNSTLSPDDYYLGISASTNVTITLLDASELNEGQSFTIKDEGGSADSYTFIIEASGSQKIDSDISVQIESPYGALNLYTDGVSKYFIF